MNETQQIYIVNPSMSLPSTSKSIDMPGTTQVNLDNVQDFSNVCRTCATITEFVIPIFAGEGLQNNLADKIHKHLPIKVAESDILPRVVCYQCASTLLAWHELVTCCHHADLALRARLAADNATGEKDSKPNLTLEDDIESKSKNDKEYMTQTTKSTVLPAGSMALQNRSSTSPIQPITLPLRPLAVLAKAVPPVQVVAPLIQTVGPSVQVMTPPVSIITPPVLPMAVPIQSISSHTLSSPSPTSREPPNYAPPHRRCDYCNTTHPEDKYSEHMVKNHSDFVFFCEECNRFVSKTVLVIHMSLHAYGYIPKKELKSNMNITCESNDNHDNQNPTQENPQTDVSPTAEVCDTRENNQENEFSDHSDAENTFDPIPESVFEAIEDSQDVQPGETSQTPEVENLSGESNTSNLSTQKESKKSHKKIRTCPICSRKFTASSSFFYHIKFTHKRVKEHECDVCSRKFATRASLTAHSTTHTGERQFECKECKKRFGSKASLYIHEQIHNGIKNWSCTLCHRSFRWKTHLERHMKRHSAEKGHLCATCGRGFSVRCDLLRHVRTHSAGNFACTMCSLVFAQLRYLKVHMTKKHAEKCDADS